MTVRVVAAIAALGFGACGGDEERDPGPAAVAPATASIYADAVISPDADDREALDSSLGKLVGDVRLEGLAIREPEG